MQGGLLRFKFGYELGYCLTDLLVSGLTLEPLIAAYGLIDGAALVTHGVHRWIGRERAVLSVTDS
jgi:hypothetical protein